MANLLRLYSGRSWYPEFDLSHISMAKGLKIYRDVAQRAMADNMTYQTEKQLGIDVAWGKGKIIDKNTVEVNGKIYLGKNLVIGTGSSALIPNIPGNNLPGVMTYADNSELTKDPKRLVIIGGGNIGIGKAGMFAAFGTKVTVLEKERALGKWDEDVRKFIFRQFKRQGIDILEGVEVKAIKGKEKVEAVVAEVDGKTEEFPCDSVLFSIGLVPNSEVAKPLGVKIGSCNEIVVNERCQSSIPGIYAVGDIAGTPYLISIARKRGMIAAKNIMGEDAKMDYSFVPAHVYVPPLEATCVGLTEAEARKEHKVAILKLPTGGEPVEREPETYSPELCAHSLPAYGRMLTMNLMYFGRDWHGFLKAIVDADTRKFLGFHHVGDGAKVSFQYLSYLLKIGWTVDQMAELNEIFLNAEHFIQLTRLVAGYKDISGLSRLGKRAED